MIPTIIIAISIILDGVLSNFLPYTVNALSLFTPMLTVVSIFIILHKKRKVLLPNCHNNWYHLWFILYKYAFL